MSNAEQARKKTMKKDTKKASMRDERGVGNALSRAPAESSTWRNLGIERKAHGDIAGAIAAFEEALALDPKDAVAWRQLGKAKLLETPITRETMEGVKRALERTLELDPTNVEAWHDLGVARSNLSDYLGTIEAFEYAVKLDPTQRISWEGLAYESQKVHGYDARATKMWKYVVALDPKGPMGWYQLGFALRRWGGVDGEVLYCWEQATALGMAKVEQEIAELRRKGVVPLAPQLKSSRKEKKLFHIYHPVIYGVMTETTGKKIARDLGNILHWSPRTLKYFPERHCVGGSNGYAVMTCESIEVIADEIAEVVWMITRDPVDIDFIAYEITPGHNFHYSKPDFTNFMQGSQGWRRGPQRRRPVRKISQESQNSQKE